MPKQIPQIPRQALLAMMIGRKQYLSRRRRERWRERHRSLPAVNSASYANSTYYNDVYRQFRRNSLVSSHLTHNRSQGPHNHMEQPHSNYHQGGCCTHIWFTSRQLSMKAPDPSAWSLRPAWTSNIGTHTHTSVKYFPSRLDMKLCVLAKEMFSFRKSRIHWEPRLFGPMVCIKSAVHRMSHDKYTIQVSFQLQNTIIDTEKTSGTHGKWTRGTRKLRDPSRNDKFAARNVIKQVKEITNHFIFINRCPMQFHCFCLRCKIKRQPC